MDRLTEWSNGHGSLVKGAGYTKLARYEDTGMEPEEISAILTTFPPLRLNELVSAAKSGRLVIKPEPLDATCGNCVHFQRHPGKASGTCDCRTVRPRGTWGLCDRTLYVTQSRKRCRDDYKAREMEE